MKKNPLSIVIGALLLLVFGLLLFVYQVRTTEVAVVTTFGKPTDQKTEPGPYFQWPWPINRVYKLDKRVRNLEITLQQSTTRDQNSLLVMSYAGWAIDNPSEFFPRFDRGSHIAAEAKLKEMLLNAQKQVIGKHGLMELINLNASEIRFSEIEQEMAQLLRDQCRSQKYGIDIKFVGIKRLELPLGTSTAVLDRMSAERRQLVTQIQAEGAAAAAEIRNRATIDAATKINQANSDALRIKGLGDAEVAKTLEVFQKNPELAKFLLDLGALEGILANRATLIMDAGWPLIDLLNPGRSQKETPLK